MGNINWTWCAIKKKKRHEVGREWVLGGGSVRNWGRTGGEEHPSASYTRMKLKSKRVFKSNVEIKQIW